MYNIVFLDIDKIDNDFYINQEKIGELEKLAHNIEGINPDCQNYLVFTTNEDVNKNAYKIGLIKAYFEAHHRLRNKIITGPVIEEKKSTDVSNYFKKENEPINSKKYQVIESIENNGIKIDYIVHITNGIDFFLYDDVIERKNISLTEGYDDYALPMDIDDSYGRNITYLISDKKGIEGFNDCFETYYESKNVLKLNINKF